MRCCGLRRRDCANVVMFLLEGATCLIAVACFLLFFARMRVYEQMNRLSRKKKSVAVVARTIVICWAFTTRLEHLQRMCAAFLLKISEIKKKKKFHNSRVVFFNAKVFYGGVNQFMHVTSIAELTSNCAHGSGA